MSPSANLVEFSLDGPRGKLVTSQPKSAAENLAERRGDRVCNSHGEISAQEAFAALNDSEYVRSIQKIYLGTKSFTLAAAELLCEKIKQMENLEVADISDTISGIMEAEAYPVLKAFGKALENLPKLREIHCNRNALGPRVDAFDNVLTGRLTAASFCVTGMSAEACQIAAKAFISNGPLPLQLRQLHFAESTSNSAGAEAISTMLKHCAYLEDFRLASVRSGAQGMKAICREIRDATLPLADLDLSDNSFVEKGCDASSLLGSMLNAVAPTLRRLTLKSICLTAAGYHNVHEGLSACNNLEALYLDDSNVDNFSVVPEFAKLLGHGLPALRELSISEFFVGDSGVDALAEALERRAEAGRPALRVLDLRTNELSDDALRRLLPAIAKLNASSGSSCGFENGGLRLDGNELSDDAVTFLHSVFESAGRAAELAEIDPCGEAEDPSMFSDPAFAARVKLPDLSLQRQIVEPGFDAESKNESPQPQSRPAKLGFSSPAGAASSRGIGFEDEIIYEARVRDHSAALRDAATTFIRDCQEVRNRSWPAALRGRLITVSKEVVTGDGQTVTFSAEVNV
eukprot:INCI9235.1.p1 GENE.INCI9235.1~~INCI9235.1.p1  ORF type:complete len:573 (+),score=115.46 INCI9235.1:117-1835(+)